MRAGTIARVYAETLFRSADRHQRVDDVDESVRALSAVLDASPEFRRFLAAPQISADRKRALVSEALQARIDPLVSRFLELVIEKHRERVLEEIVLAWKELLDARANRQSATVTAATMPDPETMARVQAAWLLNGGDSLDEATIVSVPDALHRGWLQVQEDLNVSPPPLLTWTSVRSRSPVRPTG